MHSSSLPYSGYSPEISMELEVEGQTFSIGSMSTDKLILRNPAPLPPTAGVARLTVDEKLRFSTSSCTRGSTRFARSRSTAC